MSELIERIPPQNIDAEKSVLGSMLLEKDAIFSVVEILKPGDFYRDAHRVVFEAVTSLANRGEPVDLVTVAEELRQRGVLEQVGGVSYLTTLVNCVPTAANAAHYARIVEEKSILRSLISAATRVAQMGYEAGLETDKILDEAEHAIFEVTQKRNAQGFVPLRSILIDAFMRIEKLYSEKGGLTGIPSGYPDLDRMTSGWQSSDLIIIAARPSMGKTTFTLNLAQKAAVDMKLPVAYFSLEMSKEQLAQKLLCAEAKVDSQRLRTGQLADSDWPLLSYALGRLSEANIFIDDTPGISAMEVRAKARRLKAEHQLRLIFIDYLQLMQSRSRSENRQQEVAEISRSLKALARELDLPVIACSQLSRAVEQRTQKVPSLADLRESGSLEQDADIVAFLYRDDYYNPDSEKKNITELIIAKHRNGPTGTVEMLFQKEYSRFDSLEKSRNSAG